MIERITHQNKDLALILRADYKSQGIEFFATPWDFPSVDFLEDLNVPAYKVASCDLTNTPLLRYIASKGRPTIISTGGGTLEAVDRAVGVVQGTGPDCDTGIRGQHLATFVIVIGHLCLENFRRHRK